MTLFCCHMVLYPLVLALQHSMLTELFIVHWISSDLLKGPLSSGSHSSVVSSTCTCLKWFIIDICYHTICNVRLLEEVKILIGWNVANFWPIATKFTKFCCAKVSLHVVITILINVHHYVTCFVLVCDVLWVIVTLK